MLTHDNVTFTAASAVYAAHCGPNEVMVRYAHLLFTRL